MRRWSAIFAALVLCLSLAACGSTSKELTKEEAALVGTWTSQFAKFVFNEDGSGQIIHSIVGYYDAGSDFTYTAENGVLKMEVEGTKNETNYTIKGDTLTIKNETGESSYTREK